MNVPDLLKVFGIVAIIVLAVTARPWLLIWSINTPIAAGSVTGFFIPFDFWTWLAALFIGGLRIIPTTRRG